MTIKRCWFRWPTKFICILHSVEMLTTNQCVALTGISFVDQKGWRVLQTSFGLTIKIRPKIEGTIVEYLATNSLRDPVSKSLWSKRCISLGYLESDCLSGRPDRGHVAEFLHGQRVNWELTAPGFVGVCTVNFWQKIWKCMLVMIDWSIVLF